MPKVALNDVNSSCGLARPNASNAATNGPLLPRMTSQA